MQKHRNFKHEKCSLRDPALAVKRERNRMRKTIICCGSKQRANPEEKQNPIPAKYLVVANYTSVGSLGKKLKEKMLSTFCLTPTVNFLKEKHYSCRILKIKMG